MESEDAETDELDCILCTGVLDTRQNPTPSSRARRPPQHGPLTEEALRSFSKLLGGVIQDPNSVPLSFTHSPHLRFCLKCTQKVGRVHEVFAQIEDLRVQLAIFKDELEEELLHSYRKSTSGTWNRSTTLRHRIIRQLKLEPSLPISIASRSQIPNELYISPTTVIAIRSQPSTLGFEMKDPDPGTAHDQDTNSEIYEDDIMDTDPLFIEPDSENHAQAQENETIEYKPDIEEGIFQQILDSTTEPLSDSYNLKPCLIELGSRIDDSNPRSGTGTPRSRPRLATNRNLLSAKKTSHTTVTTLGIDLTTNFTSKFLSRASHAFPKRCDFVGCTTTTIFKHRSRYEQHMKVHTLSKVKTQSNPLYTIMEGLSYPALCPVENCTSVTTYCDRKNMKKHISRAHLQLKRSALTVSELEAKLDSCTYPTKCRILGCEKQLEMATREELRCHLRASHHIIRKLKQCRSALGREISTLTFPTTCPRLKCKCRTVFNSSETLRQHLKMVHERPRNQRESTEPDGELHVCPICKLSFLSKLSLRHHSSVHEAPIVNATCEVCGTGFRSTSRLEVHRETHHSIQPSSFLCTKCPKMFQTTQALENHIQRHEGEKKYFCRICPKGFMFRVNLNEHERFAHWEELGLEQIKCHICDKIYSQTKTLRIHMSSHTGDQRFCCTECEYKTDYGKDYREHVATVHQKDSPFSCTECDKSFKLERRLRQHMLSHDEEAISCEYCSKRFASRRTLRIHKEKKHGELPPDREYKEGVIAEFDV